MKLHHIGYVVRDLASACRRFEKEGALVTSDPIDDPAQGVRVQFLTMGENTTIELVSPLEETSVIQARLNRGGGLDHLCFMVDNLEAMLENEEEQGGLVVCPPVFAAALQCKIAFVMRRSGLIVEFLEAESG
ncbi:VOC family protein [Planctomycetota bacterium]